VHGLVAFFFEVIALAIILLLIGLLALVVLVVATRMILASIVSMRIVGSLVIVIVPVALMIVALFALMLSVAWFTAARDGKMSHLLLFWLLFVLGNLLKNAGCFIVSLTFLEKGNKPKRVHGHCIFVSAT
jgi:hypothetical protein